MISPDDFLANLAVEVVYDLLKAGVSRLTALARGSPEEQALKRAVLSGQVNYVTGARAVAFGADARDVVVVTGDNDIVQVFKGPDADTIRQVFRQVLAEIESDRHARALKEYFAALREYCRNLPYLTLYHIRPPKKLDEVYVPLQLRERRPEHEPGSKGDETQRFPVSTPATLSIAEVLQQARKSHLLILGEPGVGKSTLLRRLAEQAWDNPQAIGLERPYLPMLVPLRTLASRSGALDRRLAAALSDELSLVEDLPEGFFRAWAQQMDASWLLLLDGLDEVPEDRRTSLLQWLDGILPLVGEGRVIITARPSVYDSREWEAKPFSAYDIQLFTSKQTKALAEKWFGNEAPAFLNALEKVRAAALSGTPLLLTIAAKVYLRRKVETGAGSLPERRSQLYDEFINTLLKEAETRGLRAELGDDVADVAKPALARLALAMTEHPEWTDEDSLAQVMAEYLGGELHFGRDLAEMRGRRFVQVMGRRSGVFTGHNKVYGWIHPTFREYLAAWAFRNKRYNLKQAWRRLVSHWKEEKWREVVLHYLALLGDDEQDVTRLLKAIWRKGDDGLQFSGEALREHAKVKSSLSNAIIDAMLANIRREGKSYFPNEERMNLFIVLLGSLRDYPRAGDGLVNLMRDARQSVEIHKALFFGYRGNIRVWELLAISKYASVVFALANNIKVAGWLQLRVTEVLEELVQTIEELEELRTLKPFISLDEGIRVLRTLAYDPQLETKIRVYISEALWQHRHATEAIRILFSLASNLEVHRWICKHITTARESTEWTNQMVNLIRDEQIEPGVRIYAVKVLGRVGQTQNLIAIARDPQLDTWVRRLAIYMLERIAQTNDLLSAVHNTQIEPWVRILFAEALKKRGRSNEAIQAWFALFCDTQAAESARIHALEELAEALRKLESDQARCVWLSLLHDTRIEIETRKTLLEALWQANAIQVDNLLELARDTQVDTQLRVTAIKLLKRVANSNLFLDLEHLARTDGNANVRRAAQKAWRWHHIVQMTKQAIARIRQRMAQSGSERGEE